MNLDEDSMGGMITFEIEEAMIVSKKIIHTNIKD
jgi:hypothetical protein